MYKKLYVIILLIVILSLNFFFFGYLDQRPIKLGGDEPEYDSYAVNIVNHGIYSMDGETFSAWREPSYILFISGIYAIFGTSNFRAVHIIQMLLILIASILVYLFFVHQKQPRLGLIGAIIVVANPYFAYSSARLLTEIFFAFLLVVIFYMILGALRTTNSKKLRLEYLGLTMGVLALARLQFIFFPLILVALGYIWRSRFHVFRGKNAMKLLIYFAIPLLAWGLYCFRQTGKFMFQESRVDIQLYVRAVRVQESWPELIRYTGWQLKNTFLGVRDQKWWQKDYRFIIENYDANLYPKSESIQAIFHHPAKYVLGNFVEFLKIISLYHAFAAPHFSKYFRVLTYLLFYGMFVYGIFWSWRARKVPDSIVIALLFLFYNFFMISLFNGAPIYNVPLHIFYVIVGLAGIGIYRDKYNEV